MRLWEVDEKAWEALVSRAEDMSRIVFRDTSGDETDRAEAATAAWALVLREEIPLLAAWQWGRERALGVYAAMDSDAPDEWPPMDGCPSEWRCLVADATRQPTDSAVGERCALLADRAAAKAWADFRVRRANAEP